VVLAGALAISADSHPIVLTARCRQFSNSRPRDTRQRSRTPAAARRIFAASAWRPPVFFLRFECEFAGAVTTARKERAVKKSRYIEAQIAFGPASVRTLGVTGLALLWPACRSADRHGVGSLTEVAAAETQLADARSTRSDAYSTARFLQPPAWLSPQVNRGRLHSDRRHVTRTRRGQSHQRQNSRE